MQTTETDGSAAPRRPQPLRGVRVIDFTSVIAGPYCTYQLALLGADVIKVERPGEGDFTRRGAPIPGAPGLTAGYVAQNADKRSVVLDLAQRAGLDAALALIAEADVVVENFTPGVADRLGIGYEAARARNPRVVYASLSGYGQTGLYSRRPAYDHVIQAMSGVTMLTGTLESTPNRIGPPLFDYIAGIYGAFAVLAAIMEREQTGQAQKLDIAMLDAAIVAMASTASAWANGGVEPRARGNSAASGSPASGTFKTQDGLLSLVCNTDEQMARFDEALGAQSLMKDPRFATDELRRVNEAAFRDALQQRLMERTADHWEALLSPKRVPAVRVRTLPEVLRDSHVVEREVMSLVTDQHGGAALFVPTLGFRWNDRSLGPSNPPARLGEHTDEVLSSPGRKSAPVPAGDQ